MDMNKLIKFLAESQQQQQAAELQQQQQLVQQFGTQQQQLILELGCQNRDHQQQSLQQLVTLLPRPAEPQPAGATGPPSLASPIRLTKMGPNDDPQAFLHPPFTFVLNRETRLVAGARRLAAKMPLRSAATGQAAVEMPPRSGNAKKRRRRNAAEKQRHFGAAAMLGLLPTFPCLLLLSLPGPSSGSDDDGTVVLTTSGPIQGKRLQAGSSTVTAFLGIPYAEPPVGALRFHKKELKLPFVPTPDGDFLLDTPPRLLQARHGQPIPIAAGFTTNEGSYILYFAASSLNLDNASSIGWEELLQVVRLIVPGVPDEAIQAMARWYIQEGEEQGEARYRWAMEQIAGDYVVVCPILEMARQETEAGNPVYTYHFAHRSSGVSAPEWMGVPQGSEMPYEFGTLASMVGSNHTEAEVALSRRAMHYLAVYTWSG
ncbi:cholinesterase-like [Emys orbicularis]|uniref:cholinesterase-like n=1 Tax=Emys orbicularis TaxID=82168 RepID=UPI0031FBA8E4